MTTSESIPNDGGSAFPCEQGHCPDGTWNQTFEAGMSLRDWFAGQALAGICGDGIPGSHHIASQTARDAYEYADAMLLERQK